MDHFFEQVEINGANHCLEALAPTFSGAFVILWPLEIVVSETVRTPDQLVRRETVSARAGCFVDWADVSENTHAWHAGC